jgi:transposase
MSKGMPSECRVRVPDRSQMVMTMGCPDDLIPAEHPARLIWGVSGRLNLSDFYQMINAVEGSAGRDANDPRLMVSLWLYAAIRGVGSARELDRLCKESKPFQWLCGGVSMNYHTLSDFRVRHGEALDKLFTQVIASLVEKKLVKVWRISQDGTRVRACAGTSSFRRKQRLEQLLEQAKAHVEELKAQLDDPAAGAGLSAKRKAAKRRAAQDRRRRINAAMKRVEQLDEERAAAAKKSRRKNPREGEVRASTTDAEARVMKMGNGGFSPAVNI